MAGAWDLEMKDLEEVSDCVMDLLVATNPSKLQDQLRDSV